MADRVGITIELIGKDAAISGLQQVQSLVNQINGKKANVNVGVSGASRVISTMGTISKSIGGVLTTTSSVMSRTGSMLTSMGNMFGGSILNKASWFAVGKGVQMVTEGLSNATSRFDTFRTFPKLMQAIGYSASDSKNAIQKLNDAVLGLPTPLNDIVESSKQFIQLYGDINKGTDLAIAANNAFLANASDSQQVYYGMKQIRDILSKGNLQEREWESLFAALGVSAQYIGEQMGYGADQIGEFKTALKKGDIDANDFLNALIQAGTGTGKLVELAEISKDTMSGTIQNLKTAFANLGQQTLEALDQLAVDTTGEGLPGNIKRLSDAIKKDLIPAVTGWVSDNGDKIVGFFQKLADFNWGKLGSSVMQNAEGVMNFFGKIVDKVGEDNIIKFVSFAMTWASPLGKALQLMSKPIGLAGMLFTKFGRFMRRMGKGGLIGGGVGGGGATRNFTDGLLAIRNAFLGASAVVGVAAEIGLVIGEYAKIAEIVSNADIDNLETNIKPIGKLAGIGGIIAGAGTALFGVIDKFGGTPHALVGEGLTAGFEALVGGVGLILGEFTDLASDISSADLTNFNKNWGILNDFVQGVMTNTGGTTAVMGVISGITGFMGALAFGAGEMLTAGQIENARSTLHMISEAVNVMGDISGAELPSGEKMQRVATLIDGLEDAFGDKIKIPKKTVNAIKRGLETVTEIANTMGSFETINGTHIDFLGSTSKIKQVADALGQVYRQMETSFGGTSIFTKWSSDNQPKIVENMRSVLDNVSATIDTFNELQQKIDEIGAQGNERVTGTTTVAGVTSQNTEFISDSFQRTINQVREIIDGMESISSEISAGGSMIATLHDRIVTSWEDNIVKNYTDVLTKINGLIDVIKEVDPTQAGIGGAPQGAIDPFTRKTNQVKQLLSGVADMMTEVCSQIPLIGTAVKWFDSSANKNILSNLETSMASLRSIIVKTNLAMSAMDRIDMDEMDSFKETVTTFMGTIREITASFTQEGLSENAADSGVDYGVMSTNLENISLAMQSVKGTVQSIAEMESDLESIMGRGRDGSTMSQLSEAMQGLRTALANIPEDADEVQEKAEQMKTAIDSVNSIVTTMAGMQENMAMLTENQAAENMGGLIQSIVSALTGGGDIEAVTAQMQAISDMVGNINTNLDTLTQVDFSGLTDQVSTLYGELQTLQGALESVYGALQNVSRGAIEANTAIGNLATTASSRAGDLLTLVGTLGSLAGALAGATSNANNLAGAINSIPSQKTVTVTYQQIGSPSGGSVGGGGGTYFAATGGLVPQYRAFGGTIFKPRGTDTVPAMLTPGEFVLRRKTVGALGLPFLHMLNGLNIPAAIDRLISGVSTPAGYGMVTHDNRRIINNNQKVNQTVYTNNPHFAKRISNRYARSL